MRRVARLGLLVGTFLARGQFEERTVGTVFEDGEFPEGQTLEEALRESS